MNESVKSEIATMQPDMRKYALRLTNGKADEAEDLMQEASTLAMEKAEMYKEQGKLKSWLFAIMNNLYINMSKRRARICVRETLPDVAVQAVEPDESQALLQGLPAKERAIVALRMKGYKYKEIASILAIPIGSVKSALNGAKKIAKKIAST